MRYSSVGGPATFIEECQMLYLHNQDKNAFNHLGLMDVHRKHRRFILHKCIQEGWEWVGTIKVAILP